MAKKNPWINRRSLFTYGQYNSLIRPAVSKAYIFWPESQMFEMPRYGRSGNPADTMIPMARIGKRNDPTEDNYYKSIPMPRIG